MIVVVLKGLSVALPVVLIVLLGQYMVHRLVPLPVRASNATVVGAIYGALYVMYGVTLAFSILLSWQALVAAEATTDREAANAERLYRLAGRLPESERDEIQGLVESYARAVVEEEWPLLANGRASEQSPRAGALANELQESIQDIEPNTSAEQAIYAEALTRVGDLQSDREARLLQSHWGIPPELWAVLSVGGVLTVSLTFLLGTDPPWLQRLALAALTVVVVLLLYAVYNIQYPFSGSVRVGPDAFEHVLQEVEEGHNS